MRLLQADGRWARSARRVRGRRTPARRGPSARRSSSTDRAKRALDAGVHSWGRSRPWCRRAGRPGAAGCPTSARPSPSNSRPQPRANRVSPTKAMPVGRRRNRRCGPGCGRRRRSPRTRVSPSSTTSPALHLAVEGAMRVTSARPTMWAAGGRLDARCCRPRGRGASGCSGSGRASSPAGISSRRIAAASGVSMQRGLAGGLVADQESRSCRRGRGTGGRSAAMAALRACGTADLGGWPRPTDEATGRGCMRRDVLELRPFYASGLGAAAREMVGRKVGRGLGRRPAASTSWASATPPRSWSRSRPAARRVVAAMPAQQGVEVWPVGGAQPRLPGRRGRACPSPTPCSTGSLAVHALEESRRSASPCCSEVWRVLAPSGRVIVAVAARSGLVGQRREATPFGHGRPYTRRQLAEPAARGRAGAHRLDAGPLRAAGRLAGPLGRGLRAGGLAPVARLRRAWS